MINKAAPFILQGGSLFDKSFGQAASRAGQGSFRGAMVRATSFLTMAAETPVTGQGSLGAQLPQCPIHNTAAAAGKRPGLFFISSYDGRSA